MNGDDGASMVLVAIVLFSLVAMAAVAVDTAALVQERRTLQNSADAAALALAQKCSKGACGIVLDTARPYADANADDGRTDVESICGTGAGMTACTDPPVGYAGYVRVTTVTQTTNDTGRVPFSFAKAIGPTGQAVHATATAAWGGESSLNTLPLTIGECEWKAYTNNNTTYAPPPPYTSWPTERVVYFHGPTNPCGGSPSGSILPGGFGWLHPENGTCEVHTSLGEVPGDPGNSPPSDCSVGDMAALKGTVVHLPIYNRYEDGGSNAKFFVSGYAAFYLTGYNFTGQYKEKSLVPPRNYPCSGNDTCISGFFVGNQLAGSPGTIGGTYMGSLAVQLVA